MVVSKKSFGLWIFIFLLFLLVVGPRFSSAFLSGWNYRQPITIHNPNSNDLTDFQVKVILNSSVVGPNFNWANDEDSIRFTDSNDNLLNYWIESYNSTTDKAIIWVNVTSLPANADSTIYLYYHNPSATSESNGDATFPFFDDFSGSSLDTTKWTEFGTGTLTVESNNILLDGQSDNKDKGIVTANPIFDNIQKPYRILVSLSKGGLYSDDAFTIYFDATNTVGSYGHLDSANTITGSLTGIKILIGHTISSGSGAADVSTNTYWSGNKGVLEIKSFPTSKEFKFSSEGITDYVSTTDNINSNAYLGLSAASRSSGTSVKYYWVAVGKASSTEPTTTFGSEEAGGVPVPAISINSPLNGAVLYNYQATNISLLVEGHNLNTTKTYSCEYQLCDYNNPTDCFPFIPFDNLTSSHNATTSLYPPLGHWSLNVTCTDQQNNSIVLSAKTSFSTNTKQKIFVINSWDNTPTQNYDFTITNTNNNNSLSLSSTSSEQDSFPALGTYYYASFDSTSLMSDYAIDYSDERFFPNNSMMYDVKFPYLNLTATTPLGKVWLGEFSTAPLLDNTYDGLLYVPTDNELFHQQSPTSGVTYYGTKYLLNLSFSHNLIDAQGTFNKVSSYHHAHLYPSSGEIIGYYDDEGVVRGETVVFAEPAYNPLSSSLILNGNNKGVLCADCGGQTIAHYVDNTHYVSNTQTISVVCDGLSQNLTTSFNQYYGKYNFIVLNEKDNSPFIINNTVLSGQVVCENKTIDLSFTNNTDDNVLVDCIPTHYNVFVDFNTTGSSMGRSYLMPAGEQTLTSYLINLYNTQAYKITFSFEGLENMNHPHISFENNQRVIMDSYPDLTYSITNYFLPNHEYSLVLYDGTEARSLGVVLADSSSTKIIRISPFTYQGTNPIYKDISVTYNITNSLIRIQYYDDLNETNSVAVTITRQNDSKILFSNIVYDSSLITFTYNGNITNDSVYVVNVDVNHKKYGKFSLEKALSIGKLIPLSFDNNTLTMFSIGIIIVSLLILGALGSLAIEIFALLGEIALFYAFGWLVISSALFGLIIGILIIALFGMFIKGGGL